MLNDFTGAAHVYIACEYTDIQKGIDNLAMLAQQYRRLMEGLTVEQLSFLFIEAEVYEDQAAAQKEESFSVAAHERKRRSGSVKDFLPENIPVNIVVHRIS